MGWKISAAKTLPIIEKSEWNADEAKERVFAWAGWPNEPNPAKAKKAFLVYDSENDENMGAYKALFADVVDNKLVAINSGLEDAASIITKAELPENIIAKANKIKDLYLDKLPKQEETKKSEIERPFMDFVITKASVGADGVKRWAATVSKFTVDEQGDEVTKEFYKSAIENVDKGIFPMPALVISHYDDGRLEKVTEPVPDVFKAGITTSIYIDGDKPKAKGEFLDTPLGNAAFNAIKADLDNKLPHEERARISMAFRPLEDGIQKSDQGHNVYTNGIIRHFAITRVPIVKETEIMVQKSSTARKTKFDDAKSIVGEELATELDKAYNNSKNKSETEDGLIEKSEDVVVEKAAKEMYMKNGKFDMGDCISVKLGEGKERKQAIAMCLGMQSGKADLLEKMELLNAFDEEACKQEFIVKKGLTEAAADIAVTSQLYELAKILLKGEEMTDNTTSVTNQIEKNKLSASLPECVKSYTDDGMDEAEAKKLCNSDEAVKARILAAAEKGDFEGVVKAVITDETVEIVEAKEGSETVSKSEESVNSTIVEEKSETSDKSEETTITENTVTGEPETAKAEAAQDVNAVAKADTENTSNPYDNLLMLYKSTLANADMSRGDKVIAVNAVLAQLGELAKADISKNTPATAADQAELIKAAIEEAITPLTTELTMLKIKSLEIENQIKGAPIKPVSKQLTNTHSKALVENSETPRAMNAREMAEATVRF